MAIIKTGEMTRTRTAKYVLITFQIIIDDDLTIGHEFGYDEIIADEYLIGHRA